MANTEKRKNFSTNLDKELLRKIKIIAADFEKNQNEIIEEGISLVVREITDSMLYGKLITINESDNRKLKNTTIDRKLHKKLNQIKARTDININTLIEEGLRKIIKKYKDKYTKGAKSL
ncbi:MAG: ribbon-helix-helix domain-containing protein [Halanaerobiales bacterium]